MRTTGVVKWFDRSTGFGELALDDGGERVVVQRRPSPAAGGDDTAHHRADARVPPRADWRGDAPDVDAAVRAGTWGDGGRDY